MEGKSENIVLAAGPASLAELREMAVRTGQHIGVAGPSVTVLPDRTVAGRCIYFRTPIGKAFPSHFCGSAQRKVKRVTAGVRRAVAESAELDAILKAYPEFAGVAGRGE